MNQKRFNQMRSLNRGQEQQGLQQILQPSAAGQLPPGGNQGGNQVAQQSVRRKTTYTRTELLCRGLPTTQIPRRSPRANRGTYAQSNTVTPHTPLSAGQGRATSPTMPPRQRSLLPRATRLQSPNPNPSRMRTEIDLKADQVSGQLKNTPRRLPNTPHASPCNIPYPGRSGIPVLDRSRARECHLKQQEREIRECIDIVGITDTSSRSSSPVGRTTVRMVKPIPLPEDTQNKSFVYLCKPVKKVKELLTARELRHSCENLELAGFGVQDGKSNLPKTNSEELLHSKAMEQGLELSSITEMSLTPTDSSAASQLKEQLQLQKKELQLQQLENSNQERLICQLTELRQRQEYVSQKEQRQKEMDMVCQNLPTLQHEIRLLRELNEKLETTLRRSNAARQRSSHNMESSQSSTAFYTPRCGPMLFPELPLARMGFLHVEHLARITQRVHIVAFAHSLAVVREFRIETKTLNELKSSDETQCFYLPQPKMLDQQPAALVDSNPLRGSAPPPLHCTNLRMLRENPNALLQQLRRGGGGGGSGSYNLLDHDMFMFINSLSKKSDDGFLYSSLAVGIPFEDNSEYPQHQLHTQSLELSGKMACQQVNSTTQTEEEELVQEIEQEKEQETEQEKEKEKEEEKEEEKEQEKEQVDEQDQKERQAALSLLQALRKKPDIKIKKPKQPVVTTRKLRMIHRSPIQSNVEPKVRMKLFKTVLVGLVQVGVFLVLIMAFMYPDARC